VGIVYCLFWLKLACTRAWSNIIMAVSVAEPKPEGAGTFGWSWSWRQYTEV
jgi:hypothetical protein